MTYSNVNTIQIYFEPIFNFYDNTMSNSQQTSSTQTRADR